MRGWSVEIAHAVQSSATIVARHAGASLDLVKQHASSSKTPRRRDPYYMPSNARLYLVDRLERREAVERHSATGEAQRARGCTAPPHHSNVHDISVVSDHW